MRNPFVKKQKQEKNDDYKRLICKVNNYIVRSYRDVIVVTNTATRRTNKA